MRRLRERGAEVRVAMTEAAKAFITPLSLQAVSGYPVSDSLLAGLLIQTFDLPGIGIFLGISSRFVRLFRFVAPAAIVGILLRTVLHLTLF